MARPFNTSKNFSLGVQRWKRAVQHNVGKIIPLWNQPKLYGDEIFGVEPQWCSNRLSFWLVQVHLACACSRPGWFVDDLLLWLAILGIKPSVEDMHIAVHAVCLVGFPKCSVLYITPLCNRPSAYFTRHVCGFPGATFTCPAYIICVCLKKASQRPDRKGHPGGKLADRVTFFHRKPGENRYNWVCYRGVLFEFEKTNKDFHNDHDDVLRFFRVRVVLYFRSSQFR